MGPLAGPAIRSPEIQILNWLGEDPLMGGLMPEATRGGLVDHLGGERCKFGPFTFGGGRNFPFLESTDAAGTDGAAAAWAAGGYAKKSQRLNMQGKKRDRIGGSTTHMDGESDAPTRLASIGGVCV